MRIKDGDAYVVVASNGGGASNPSWYRNLIAHPELWCGTARRCTDCVPGSARRGEGALLAGG